MIQDLQLQIEFWQFLASCLFLYVALTVWHWHKAEKALSEQVAINERATEEWFELYAEKEDLQNSLNETTAMRDYYAGEATDWLVRVVGIVKVVNEAADMEAKLDAIRRARFMSPNSQN